MAADPNVAQAVVYIRNPQPPHEAVLEILPASNSLSYGFMIMRQQTASFRVRREDPNITNGSARYLRPPYMVTIERPDGLHPWVGFIRRVSAPYGDPYVTFQAMDHTWMLKRALTRKSGTFMGASGRLIVDTLREVDARGYPPLDLRLETVAGGPATDHTFQLNSALDFLVHVSEYTGWEWGLDYEVNPNDVRTFLRWQPQLGLDLSNAVVWEEGIDFENVSYTIDGDEYTANAVAVGGSGDFAARQAVQVNTRGTAFDGLAVKPAALSSSSPPVAFPQLLGSKAAISKQVTDKQALFNAAQRLHGNAASIPEQISLSVVESEIDMAHFDIGDIVSVRLQTTFLGQPLTRAIRIIAQQFNAYTLVHQLEAQVIA